MSKLLHINTSVRSNGSISRQMTTEFLDKWQASHAGDTVTTLDLATNPVPHLTEQMMGAFFTPADQRSPEQAQTIALSDRLVAQLKEADVVVIGSPMYNFGISSTLKAWVDHVARAGLTFQYTANGPVGLMQGKKVYVFTSRGGVYTQGPAAAMDFQESYLRAVLGFIGITDVTFIHSEGVAMGEEAVAKAIAGSRQAIGELLAA
ncbi:FMN-dependent NADH-azoreductase [Undibacterium sp.]|jgi:FMN-dependent NADH-azoreductase|uniref:FMN-dependent NADH-azoreductase n=1 Tax=Undibacterium sp. TaxID=1914977 RepID=UPI002C22AA6E|nr:FMN-dependent NADH-azoreductase [Undibacterium sp.]HTD07197.1 FMN-dependent NADH-azoreductase [Undibacterium sp.]